MPAKKVAASASKAIAEAAKKGVAKSPSTAKGAKPASPTYIVYLSKISATGLSAKDLNGTSDPLLQAELEGEKDKPKTKHVPNTLSPTWNENLELKGTAPGNDLLRVTVYDHDLITADDIIGVGEIFIRTVPFGVTSPQTIPLIKYSKGQPDKRATKGSGGTVKLNINVQPIGKKAVEQPWTIPVYNARVEVVSGKEIPVADPKKGSTDPLVVLRLMTPNSQKTKTKSKKKSQAPTWNESKNFLLNDWENDQLKLILFDDVGPDKEEKLSEGTIDFKEFKPGGPFAEKEVHLAPVGKLPTGGIILLRVKVDQVRKPGADEASQSESDEESETEEGKVKTRAVDVNAEGPCPWHWGSYSSTYSTNFTGYTDKGPSLSTDISEASEHWHVHADPEFTHEDKGTKVQQKYTLKGVVQSGEGFMKAETEGAELYVHVALAGKHRGVFKKEEKSKQVEEGDEIKVGLRFDFEEVERGQAVEFTVWQVNGDTEIPIGYARQEIKDIDEDEHGAVELELSKPSALKHVPKGFTGPWGKLLVEFDRETLPESE